MPIEQSNSGDPPSGITINNYQQSEPLLSSRRLGELLQNRNRKKLVLFFCIGFVLCAVLAAIAHGSSPTVMNQVGSSTSKKQCTKRIIGYHRLWLPYNETDSQLSKLTHLVLDEARVDENGTVYFSDLAKQKNFMENNERARSYEVKTLISIAIRLELFNGTESRRSLTDSILNFTHDNHLDGIEISSLRISSHKDIQIAFEVCKQLRQKHQTSNKTEFIISLNVFPEKMNDAAKALFEYVNFVNIKTNSYYAPYFPFDSELIGPPTPLYGNHIDSKIGNLNQHMKSYSCISGTPSKLNIMLAFRGHYWKNVIPPNNSSDTLWMTAEIKNETAEGDMMAWNELKNSEVWDISKASWNHETKTIYI